VGLTSLFFCGVSKTRLAIRHMIGSRQVVREEKMPSYLLLLHEDPSVFEQVSPAEMQAIIQKYTDWKLRLEAMGALTRGEKLRDGTGRVLRREAGQTSIADGPYTESREVIGGLFAIDASSYDEAAALAGDCPHLEYGVIEIREIEIH
jgi:hypothetical protein